MTPLSTSLKPEELRLPVCMGATAVHANDLWHGAQEYVRERGIGFNELVGFVCGREFLLHDGTPK